MGKCITVGTLISILNIFAFYIFVAIIITLQINRSTFSNHSAILATGVDLNTVGNEIEVTPVMLATPLNAKLLMRHVQLYTVFSHPSIYRNQALELHRGFWN